MSVVVNGATTENDLAYLRELVLTRAAIILEADKDYLLQSRLEPIVRDGDLQSLGELAQKLRTTPSGPLHEKVVEAMTTNETSFFS